MPPYRGWLMLGLLLMLLGMAASVAADDAPRLCNDTSSELTTAKRQILDAINERRLSQNLFLYAPNPILCQLAQDQAQLLGSRSLDELYGLPKDKRFENNEYTGIEDWIQTTSYTPYNKNVYAVALYAFVSQLAGPDEVFNQIRRDGLMVSKRYREIGLGYVFQPTLGVHIYILVFGSQPNHLAPIAVNPEMPYQQTDSFKTGQVALSVPDERAFPAGNGQVIGNILYMNISQVPPQPNDATCTLTETTRRPYSNFVYYAVQGDAGTHTVYVRLCDALNRMVIMPVNVTTQVNIPVLESVPLPTNSPASPTDNPSDISLVSAGQTQPIQRASMFTLPEIPLPVVGLAALVMLVVLGYLFKRWLLRPRRVVTQQRGRNRRVKPTVFISYRRWVGWSAARNVHDSLTRCGADAFIDVDDIPAGVFDQYLTDNIDQRDYFLVVLAPTTLDSEWVVKEIKHAHQQRKPIIPILVDRFDLYGTEMPDDLKFLQTYNAVTLNPEFFQAGIDKICTFIGLKTADIYGMGV